MIPICRLQRLTTSAGAQHTAARSPWGSDGNRLNNSVLVSPSRLVSRENPCQRLQPSSTQPATPTSARRSRLRNVISPGEITIQFRYRDVASLTSRRAIAAWTAARFDGLLGRFQAPLLGTGRAPFAAPLRWRLRRSRSAREFDSGRLLTVLLPGSSSCIECNRLTHEASTSSGIRR